MKKKKKGKPDVDIRLPHSKYKRTKRKWDNVTEDDYDKFQKLGSKD